MNYDNWKTTEPTHFDYEKELKEDELRAEIEGDIEREDKYFEVNNEKD